MDYTYKPGESFVGSIVKIEPPRCNLKLYVCQGDLMYGGVQTTLEPAPKSGVNLRVPPKARYHNKPEDYEKLFLFDETNKDYPYKHGLANNGCSKEFLEEAEISNSDIT